MRPRDAARAIVIHDGKLLVMKRFKPSRGHYIVLLGGRLEKDEKPEDAVLREVMEESGLQIGDPQLVFIEEPHGEWGRMYVYLCQYISGEPKLPEDSEEYQAQAAGYGSFQPAWMPIAELEKSDIPFRTSRLKEELLRGLEDGFPDAPKRWTPADE